MVLKRSSFESTRHGRSNSALVKVFSYDPVIQQKSLMLRRKDAKKLENLTGIMTLLCRMNSTFALRRFSGPCIQPVGLGLMNNAVGVLAQSIKRCP